MTIDRKELPLIAPTRLVMVAEPENNAFRIECERGDVECVIINPEGNMCTRIIKGDTLTLTFGGLKEG